MRRCEICGSVDTVPNVRGVKSIGVNLGNFRLNREYNIVICCDCADRVLYKALDSLEKEVVRMRTCRQNVKIV